MTMENVVQSIEFSPLIVAFLLFVVIASGLGTYYYRKFSIKYGIVAEVNHRSMHTKVVPRGAGVAFAGIFCAAFVAYGFYKGVPYQLLLAIGAGCTFAALVGFIDDRFEIHSAQKFLLQVFLGIWSFSFCYKLYYAPALVEFPAWAPWVLAAILIFISIWFINIFNFSDGIDGFAALNAIFICGAAMLLLKLNGGSTLFIFIFALLAASCLGFLFFNKPPAQVFMGDAGSIFIGYSVITLALASIVSGQINLWAWFCILSYLIGDTTVVLIYRVLFVKKWYVAHRSHAYQNVARIRQSHAVVTYGVALYHVCYALPLAIVSVLLPNWGPIAALAALLPPLLWTWHFGPRYSNT